MNEVSVWLRGRTPAPPPELRQALESALEARSSDEAGNEPVLDALREATHARLEASLAQPGRVRESAFDLLTADALLTYACEAALESADPDAALQALVAGLVGTTSDP